MTPPRRSALPTLRRSRGVGLVTAIFLLVVLAMLGVAMVSISTSQQTSSALDVQGARAYLAARAGIEWGLFQRLRNNAPCATSGTTTSFPLPQNSSLQPFSVTVVCTEITGPVPDDGSAALLNRWTIKATACNQPTGSGQCPNPGSSADYVQRIMEVQL